MALFIGAAVKFVATFLASVVNSFITLWLRMRESRKRGKAEERNDAHEENARRKERADEIMAKPVKLGKDLVAGIRDRVKRNNA